MNRQRRGMTWTLALLGAGAVAYGVTRTVTNKRNHNATNQNEPRTYYPDIPDLY
jgi:hypothetical protein